MFESGQKMVVAVFALAVNFSMANSPYIHQENVSMIAFQRELVITIPAANPKNAAITIKLDPKNFIPVKGTSLLVFW